MTGKYNSLIKWRLKYKFSNFTYSINLMLRRKISMLYMYILIIFVIKLEVNFCL